MKKIAAFRGLSHLGFINMSKNSQFCSNIFRILCELSKESVESIHLKYTGITMREESRIILQEIGLAAFPNLHRFKLQMNRGSWLDELYEFIQSKECKLTHLDLAYNDLNLT